MSQDNQNLPPSNPRQNRTRRTVRPTPYQKPQPFWKTPVIRLLRGTIGVLESTVQQLEDETTPTGNIFNTAVIGLLLVLVLAGVAIAFQAELSSIATVFYSPKNPQIATAPPEIATTIQPTSEAQVEITPQPEITSEPEVITEEPPRDNPQPEITNTPEPEIITEEPPRDNLPAPIAKEEKIEITPEQKLIAAIEKQIVEISDGFPVAGLIKSIQADFAGSSLTVKISSDWYTFKPSQQDELAAKILRRAQELDFTHLEITDIADKLIARNPVVGNQMIIFKRGNF
ncbi:hypothetical protein [Calothrix sp. 336/3]|uniref:hypothetical protein n=1 Tax=Calothrix sp. 336/3 TaxID=1337936 RepID=UPI0004E3CCF5|nr:hypothetical protein [Calothrix sp. 336/3]AKG20605.1 hypothetical protein IJ00_04075 [Calothrix sp. 336/3]